MNPVCRTAARWGLLIGMANLLWLYLSFYLGLHTNGIRIFQVFVLVWLFLTLIGFVLTLRAARRQVPSLSYWRGVGAGTVVHPQWPDVMAQPGDRLCEPNCQACSRAA